MHELSIAESIIDMIEDNALRHNFKKVTKITLEIGVLAGIEKSALFFCFDAAAQNTLAEGAELLIQDKPAKGICQNCFQQVITSSWYEPCRYCGQVGIEINEGEQMTIKSLQVEN
ncbi:hydrogenase maturation nickel metallochaperone HypA [Psychromonas aquimarina]|uniref:hydrogenase maturation nickel metallochaperone HypA n=1 Tax=Psychromonas aquimarina TaxID=444919 RepID=UPI0004002F3D|nr:hydrogenase maturation nickel metallochaperone HypA [Psychromonas aquimarina]